MVEKLNVRAVPGGMDKARGLYELVNGRYFFVENGVLHLPVHAIETGRVLAKGKPLISLKHRDGTALVFMRAADAIDSWPHLEVQIKSTAAELGLLCE
jgi:hypothetical protein